MTPSDATNRATRQEWRDLGFHYDLDNDTKRWQFNGSKAGLLGFASMLRDYCGNPTNATLSEHDHFGPYMYLKVMTWTDCGIDENSIHGTLDDLNRLARLIENTISTARTGDTIKLGYKFTPNSKFDLVLDIEDDDFDPAMMDSGIA